MQPTCAPQLAQNRTGSPAEPQPAQPSLRADAEAAFAASACRHDGPTARVVFALGYLRGRSGRIGGAGQVHKLYARPYRLGVRRGLGLRRGPGDR